MNKLVQWFKNFFTNFENVYSMRDDCHMNLVDIRSNLCKQFPDAMIYVTDDTPYLIYKDDMIKVANILNLHRVKKFIAEKRDCDDYAFVLKGRMSRFYGNYAFGIVFTHTEKGNHALNCFLDHTGRFNYLEPQTNQIFRTKKGYKPYLIVI